MTGLVFGLCLSTASTVVLLRALEERQLIDSQRGQIAIGWLIVEDLVMVLTLVLLPAIAGMLEKATPACRCWRGICCGPSAKSLPLWC